VETLLVEEGRVVKEGEPLLKIEDRELRVDVDEDAQLRATAAQLCADGGPV
jgi:multidrug efflux pump subunit AcrA (membrane-fusion protein)